jgi:hypothetical protein
VLAVSRRWPQPEAEFRHHHAKQSLILGAVNTSNITILKMSPSVLGTESYENKKNASTVAPEKIKSIEETATAH